MNATLSVQQWLTLSQEVRLKLITIFGIPRSAGTNVNNGVVDSDGHTYEDLKSISLEKMNQYLENGLFDSDYFVLFNAVLEKVKEPEVVAKELSPTDIQHNTLERWRVVLDDIKVEAESVGLLVEFKKLITTYGIHQQDAQPRDKGTKARNKKA